MREIRFSLASEKSPADRAGLWEKVDVAAQTSRTAVSVVVVFVIVVVLERYDLKRRRMDGRLDLQAGGI